MKKVKSEFDSAMGKAQRGLAGAHQAVEKVTTTGMLSLSAVRDIEKLSQKKGKNAVDERFKIVPDYAYPNTKMNREELRKEVNEKSTFFHDLRLPSEAEGVGQVAVEVLQCFGIPRADLLKETSAFCILVCGNHAFKTDIMPPVANPMWLCKMRRACIFPVHQAYSRLYVGVFGHGDRKDGFAGRVVIHLPKLRPGCSYDVTLPLRRSAHVYSREQRGAIRLRFHLEWYSERRALLSYFPKKIPKIEPNEACFVECCDAKGFQNVCRTVHGDHMPGRFTAKQLRATILEINFTRIHVLRYLRKIEVRRICRWENKVISGFVFLAWMHSVYEGSVSYVPGHVVTLLLLYLWQNYARYAMDSSVQNGFLQPAWEEMFQALLSGEEDRVCIEPLEMEMKDESEARHASDDMVASSSSLGLHSEDGLVSLKEIAQAFREGVEARRIRRHPHSFRGSEAIDFLVMAGFSNSRADAEILGCRLAVEFKLFEHVAKKHQLRDDNSVYVFLEYDLNKYTIKTHRPWGKAFFRMIGFYPDKLPEERAVHLEMPYSDGLTHPRLTVKDSLVIRSRESRKLMSEENEGIDMAEAGNGDSDTSKHFGKDVGDLLDDGNDHTADNGDATETSFSYDPVSAEGIEIKMLKKPPSQDIDVRKKSEKKLSDVLAEARYKVHGALLHLFNDRSYSTHSMSDVGLMDGSSSGLSSLPLKRGVSLRMPRKMMSSRSYSNVPSIEEGIQAIVEDHDKLLGTGLHSHGNPWVAKVGVIVQPIIEIALGFLCLFRALFNVFTWRDPFLSFWISLLGPVVVIVLHVLPWRILLGVAGIVLVGPQNWLIRLWKERNGASESYDPDKVVKKKKFHTVEMTPEETPLFSMATSDNNPIVNSELDATQTRQVLVPDSQLLYQRFYDWPPEYEYARVKAEEAPSSDPSVLGLKTNSSLDESTHSAGSPMQLARTLSSKLSVRLKRRKRRGFFGREK